MQVTRETNDVAHHLIGDHVGKQAAHVSQHTRVLFQFRKDVVLKADRWRCTQRSFGAFASIGAVILPKNASASGMATIASASLAALTTCMGPAASTIRASRSVSTGG